MMKLDGSTGLVGKAIEEQSSMLVLNPYKDPSFNGQLDINTSLPLLVYPVIFYTKKNSVLNIGVISILQRASFKEREEGLEKEEKDKK